MFKLKEIVTITVGKNADPRNVNLFKEWLNNNASK